MRRALVALLLCTLGVNAQTPLTEFPAVVVPCQYLVDGVERLEWEERHLLETRTHFFMTMRNQPGQIGQCNKEWGQPDSCARVSWIARVLIPRPIIGWGVPDRTQAIYHFQGGIKPDDFCEIN